jgi:hypothetical protein
MGLNKPSAWTNASADSPNVPPTSNLGVPWAWLTYDCTWSGYSVCEWVHRAAERAWAPCCCPAFPWRPSLRRACPLARLRIPASVYS